MDLIKFDYPVEMTDRLDQLNMQMNFIVNRAGAFNKDKYDGIVIPFLDEKDSRYFVLLQATRIIAMMRQVKLYIDARYRSWEFFKDNPNCVFKKKREITKLIQKGNKIHYDLSCEENPNGTGIPRIFMGFTTEMIDEIAIKLYNFGVEYGG